MSAAQPDHRGGDAAGAEGLVVGHRLVERKQCVHGALHEQGGHVDRLDAVAGPVAVVPGDALGRDAPGGEVVLRGGDELRGGVAGGDGGCVEEVRPADLHGVGLEEAGVQGVPRQAGDEGVHPAVHRGDRQLDAAAVREADHADTRVALRVELGLGLLRHPVHEDPNVVPLEVGVVHHDLTAGLPEPAWVPRHNVVAVVVQALDARRAEQGGTTGARVAGERPAGSHEDGRGRLRFRRPRHREPVCEDLGAVERGDEQVRAARGLAGRHVGRQLLLLGGDRSLGQRALRAPVCAREIAGRARGGRTGSGRLAGGGASRTAGDKKKTEDGYGGEGAPAGSRRPDPMTAPRGRAPIIGQGVCELRRGSRHGRWLLFER